MIVEPLGSTEWRWESGKFLRLSTDSYAVNKLRSRQRQIPLQEFGAACISVIAGSNGTVEPSTKNCRHKTNSRHGVAGRIQKSS